MRTPSRTHLRRGEDGYTIIAMLALLVIGLAVIAAAVTAALSASNLTARSMRVRIAQQVADAGVQAQLYGQSEMNFASSYNFSGGVLGLSGFADCMPLQLNASLQVTGLTAYASSAGVCPYALKSGGTTLTPYWNGAGNDAYNESEFFSNKKEVGGTGFGSIVEFPEIVSLGCHSFTSSGCSTTPSPRGTVYSRELALLQPTGPVQAIEGIGNVTINGLSALGINTAAVVNGDVMSGGQLALPTVGIATNTNWPASGGILPTFGYVTSISNSVTTANIDHLGGYCSAGSPSSNCMIKRPAPQLSVPSTATLSTICAACGVSGNITCSSCGSGGYNSSTDTFTLTTGTATFQPGDYYFCNFNATGGTINAGASSSTPVRIFILAPNSSPCSANGYTQNGSTHVWSGGNFSASNGINNSLTGTVNGVGSTLDPSGLQVYVVGDGSYDNYTSVTLGDSATCLTKNLLGTCLTASAPAQGILIYAPTSSVTVNTGTCVVGLLGTCTLGVAGTFSGSVVGDTVSMTAATITQDFDIGNYPIDSGATAFRAAQYIQCDSSVTGLANSLSPDTSGC